MRVARRDTYGIENVGGVQIRRRIFAGSQIPDHLEVASADYEDETANATTETAAEVTEEPTEKAEKPTRRRGGKASTAGPQEDE